MRRAPCAAVRDEGALRMRRAPCGYCGCNLVQELPSVYKLVRPYRQPLRGRRGDACERRLWRRKRARRSGRIKATDKWALPTQTEPLIQQDMSPPYKGFHDNDRWGSLSCHCNETPCRAGGRETARAGGQHELFSVSKKSPMCHCEERSDVAI